MGRDESRSGGSSHGASTPAGRGQASGDATGGGRPPSPMSGSRGGDESAFADRAREIAGTAREKFADVGSAARERTGSMKDSLADALDSGADKLRQRGHAMAEETKASTPGGSTAVESDGRVSEMSYKVASGMKAAAGWLRDADIDDVKASLERQVREHPGRSLLVAIGIGYVFGRAFRTDSTK
jgi:ElaB/YqjD/DUF883 family membrane-anchored ribosome-binding protein